MNLGRIIPSILDSMMVENKLVLRCPTRMNIGGKINRLKLLLKQMPTHTDWDMQSLLMHIDFIKYLPDDILVKVDRATMGVSLEGREPFLDNKLVEYVSQMPIKYKCYKSSLSH